MSDCTERWCARCRYCGEENDACFDSQLSACQKLYKLTKTSPKTTKMHHQFSGVPTNCTFKNELPFAFLVLVLILWTFYCFFGGYILFRANCPIKSSNGKISIVFYESWGYESVVDTNLETFHWWCSWCFLDFFSKMGTLPWFSGLEIYPYIKNRKKRRHHVWNILYLPCALPCACLLKIQV